MKPNPNESVSPVSRAVRDLRVALGETQQEFAYRMKTAIRTIARYETVRPPKHVALVQFIQLAESHGLKDIAILLQSAFEDELQASVERAVRFVQIKPSEEEDHRALTLILRSSDKKHRHALAAWKRISEPIKAEQRATKERQK